MRQRWCMKFKPYLLHSHHDGSPWQVYSRTRHRPCWGGLSDSTADELFGVPKSTARAWLQKYLRDRQVGRRRGTGLWRVSSPTLDAVLDEAQWNPFVSARDLKLLLAFLGKKKPTLILRLKEVGLRARHAAMNEFLTDERKLYHLACAESNVDRKWDSVIFSDESTCSSANNGPVLVLSSANDGSVLVFRPWGERYNCRYMSAFKRSGRVSTVGAGTPMNGLECSIIWKVTWMAFSISTFCGMQWCPLYECSLPML
jgi:hypothetical protein